ncbi:hypothetical protein [Paracoccus marinaquae]|uniref:Transcriptional regulator n=1 Tax=Paracoccus marinaquae TaxID=2841926 RepID=A0ABS6AEH9_9RHOB|nr:hypothetical protein [Paracoccus marinaquae]MBU3029018.1 hypothetical protein [Paracoccus marinaquae]
MVILRLFGPISITSKSGQVLTPKGAKPQALIALLALAPEMRRSRVWLQDKLWSDRGPEQAAASLRQAIYQLRGSLGEQADILICDRRSVALAPGRVQILPRVDPREGEFLEGIDIRDPEFEDWLTVQRMEDTGVAAPASIAAPGQTRTRVQASLRIRVDRSIIPDRQLICQLVADMFARALSERALVDVQIGEAGEPTDFELDLTIFPGDSVVVRGQLTEVRSRRHCWSQSTALKPDADAPFEQARIARFVNAGTEAAWQAQLSTAPAGPTCPIRIHMAARRIFGFRDGDLAAANDILNEADDEEATALAWRLMLRMIEGVERTRRIDHAFRDEVDDLIHTALIVGSGNSMTLAAVAKATMNILGRPEDGLIVARKAVRIGPSNPFAYNALMNGLTMCGEFHKAYQAASFSSFVARSTHASHFFDMGHAVAALVTDRLDEARQFVHRAAATAPASRPALRYLAILEAHAGNLDQADSALRRLSRIEPDFDVRQIAEDPDYPVVSLRKSQLPDDVLRVFY